MKILVAIAFFVLGAAPVFAADVPSAPARANPAASAAAQPDAAAAAELRKLAASAEQELRGNILPFWLKHARNRERGGFHSFIGADMSVHDDQPRGSLLTSRILWTFSAAYRKYRDPEYLEMAWWAYRDLVENFLDEKHGGLLWTITADGQLLDAHKQIYGQVFGIYALSEYFRATGEQPALGRAQQIYRLIEKHAGDPKHGGYFDALNREWQQDEALTTSPFGAVVAPKSQNSHIHILEGYTNLLRVWPDDGLRRRHRELIELMMARIIDPRTHHLILFMQGDWTPIGDEISYGHDIELSWLLVEAAEVSGDPALLARTQHVALAIAQVTRAEGIDQDGGVYNEGNPHGPTNLNKEWWEQAEAAVGFLNAYGISSDPQQFAQALRSWDFIQEKCVDRKYGDWYNTLKRDGTPILGFTAPNGTYVPSAKLSVWKCCYHNSRACLELIERVHALLETASPP